ncbi:hypothetical protein ACHQM5_011070 [Ranunculus cassubicifolius]
MAPSNSSNPVLSSTPAPSSNSSSSNTISTPSSALSSTPALSSLTNVTYLLPVKLEGATNYLVWRSQFNPLLTIYDLEGFLDGSSTCPKQLSPGENGSPAAVNLEYILWKKQDQILLSWIFSSLTEHVLAQVVGQTTSLGVWKTLATIYNSPSQARIMQLKYQLHTLKKGDLSMAEYIQKAKTVANNLAAVTSPVSDSDLTSNILSGLPSSYNAFVTSINTRIEPFSLEDLTGHLLNQEVWEEKQEQNVKSDLSTATANIANKAYVNNNKGNYQTMRGGFRGRGRGGYVPTCQLCNRPGHKAFYCPSYSPQESNTPAAMLASSNPAFDPNWYADSGATHHLTSDMANLTTRSEYNGSDQILIGNGKGLNISHIGSSSKGSLSLQNMLHVPSIAKNLLSVSRLTRDNNVVFEFHPYSCYVKDTKGKVLLQGKTKDGLYALDFDSWNKSPTSSPSAFLGEKASKNVWHERLGHPAGPIINSIVSRNKLPVLHKEFEFCAACQTGKSHRLSFLSLSFHSSKPLEVVHSDLWGPAPVVSTLGYRYYIEFVDEFSRFTWIYPLSCKSESLYRIYILFLLHEVYEHLRPHSHPRGLVHMDHLAGSRTRRTTSLDQTLHRPGTPLPGSVPSPWIRSVRTHLEDSNRLQEVVFEYNLIRSLQLKQGK